MKLAAVQPNESLCRKKVTCGRALTGLRLNMSPFGGGFNSQSTARKTVSSRKTSNFNSRTPLNNREAIIEIVANGTNIMKKIGAPTVLIRICERTFCKAMLHYIILKPLNGPQFGEIPALLVSHPDLPKNGRTTSLGELLPLVVHSCKMFQKCSFQDIFANGCMLKLRLIKLGRLVEGPRLSKQPDLLKRLIHRDIQMMPDELKLLFCSCSSQNVTKIWSRQLTDFENREDENIWQRNLADFVPDLRLRGLRASKGECDFARWFSVIPPDVTVDKDFICDQF